MTYFLRLGFFCLGMLFALSSYAQDQHNMQQFGDYQLHYNVFNSTFLSAETAHEYGIKRSKNTALLNVSVLKKQADGQYRGIEAKVKAEHNDLLKPEPLKLQPIIETDAVYYIASFTIRHRIDVYFTIEVQVEGEPAPFKVKFQKRLYRDD